MLHAEVGGTLRPSTKDAAAPVHPRPVPAAGGGTFSDTLHIGPAMVTQRAWFQGGRARPGRRPLVGLYRWRELHSSGARFVPPTRLSVASRDARARQSLSVLSSSRVAGRVGVHRVRRAALP